MASNEERIPEGLDDLLGDIRSEKSIEPTVKKISAENFGIAKSVKNIKESQQSFEGAETSKRLTLVERKSLANERKITILKNILGYQKSDLRKNLANVTPQAVMLRNLDAILETLREEAKLEKKDEETDRRKAENTRRRLAEERIEKRYEVLRKTTEKIIAPVKGILDKIIKGILTIIGGKFLVGLIDFVTDPKNKRKIDSVVRFFSDFGPKLLTLYIMFGTKFGRAVGKLSSLIIKGAIRLGAASLMLLKRLGLRGAGGLARGLLGRRGGKLGSLIQLGATAASFIALENFFSGRGQSDDDASGFNDGGEVIGKFGIDNIPAMLSDGEFVLVPGAAKELGIPYLERLNQKHGGDNIPSVKSNTVYANDGGLIGAITNALSFLPNTGNVMAPMASKGTYQDEGTVLSKILGIPIPGSLRMKGYSDEDIRRYNRADTGDPTRFLEQFKAVEVRMPSTQKYFNEKGLGQVTSPAVISRRRAAPLEPLIPGTPSTPKSERERNEEFIRESFQNLPGNLEQIGDVTRERERILREEYGLTPDPNPAQDALRELLKPIFPKMFGPQSSVPVRRQATIARSVPNVNIPDPPIRRKPRIVVMNDQASAGPSNPGMQSFPTLPSISHAGHSSHKLTTMGIV
jgi:hypothetical protein